MDRRAEKKNRALSMHRFHLSRLTENVSPFHTRTCMTHHIKHSVCNTSLPNHTADQRKSTQCILCHQCEETTAHFLLHCSALCQARHLYLRHILDSLRRYRISVDPPNLVLILLDTNHLPSDVSSNDHEILSRDYKLHSTRSILLGATSAYQHALQLWNMRVVTLP